MGKMNWQYERGKHDNAPTPPEIYNLIIKELKFVDVCNGVTDALSTDWPDKAYCNPPYSKKSQFVEKAIKENKKGKKVLLYLPLDPTVSWFKQLYNSNMILFILMKRWQHGRWPKALYLLSSSNMPFSFFVEDIHDLKVMLQLVG